MCSKVSIEHHCHNTYPMLFVRAAIQESTVFWSEYSSTDSVLQLICKNRIYLQLNHHIMASEYTHLNKQNTQHVITFAKPSPTNHINIKIKQLHGIYCKITMARH